MRAHGFGNVIGSARGYARWSFKCRSGTFRRLSSCWDDRWTRRHQLCSVRVTGVHDARLRLLSRVIVVAVEARLGQRQQGSWRRARSR
eukprot:7573359-Pyramimonas_sp.AAC.1